MNIVNKVKVRICGKEYSLQTDETPEYLLGLAGRVDKEIRDILKANPDFGVQNAAVIVALTSLDEANKSVSGVDNIRTQIKTYVDEAAKARSAKERLAAELKEMKAKVAQLEKENKELKKNGPGYGCEQLVLEDTITPAVMVYAGDAAPQKDAEEAAAKAAKTEPKADDASSGSDDAEEVEQISLAEDGNDGAGAAEAQNDGGNTQDDNLTVPAKGGRRKKKK